MSTEMTERFRALHVPGRPLLMPNPWDAGSARLLAHLGFAALATTSGGYAGTLGRRDGGVTRDEAIGHAATVAAVVDVPVSADLEDGFAADPAGVAETVRAAVEVGLAGCSIEDYTRDDLTPSYELGLATERVRAAVEAAHTGDGLVLTARADGWLRGQRDLADTIARLQAFQEAGADVLYAPFLPDLAAIREVVRSVDRPVNVLVSGDVAAVAELAEAGVARISVGSWFSSVANGAVVQAARELLDQGTYSFTELGMLGGKVAGEAFAPPEK